MLKIDLFCLSFGLVFVITEPFKAYNILSLLEKINIQFLITPLVFSLFLKLFEKKRNYIIFEVLVDHNIDESRGKNEFKYLANKIALIQEKLGNEKIDNKFQVGLVLFI